MPATKGSFMKYSEVDMLAAVENVRNFKTPIRAAAKKFGVPRTTLKYKVEGTCPIGRRMGPGPILSKEEETEVSRWVEKMAKAGFPVTVTQLIISVEKVIKEMNRANPFKHGRPGKSWLKGFFRRNPLISKRVSQNLTISRAAITSAKILQWFSEVRAYLKEHNYHEILEQPSRIFNCDETAFFLNPKGSKVLARKGDKTIYQQVNSDEKECVTVLVTGSAIGTVAPTTVLYKYKRVPQDIAENFPEEWGLGKTDSGWMTCEAFYEFIADIFYPWLIKTEVTLPVILFVDGHTSHLSLQTSQFCDTKGIILVALYPNATHLLQPMDVAVFRTLKEGWKNKVHQWRIDKIRKDESPILKKKEFARLLREVIDATVTPSILSNGFRKCGLYPWNPQAVQVPGQEPEVQVDNRSAQLQLKYWEEGLRFLNENIDKDKLSAFQSSLDTWSGDPLDTSLFILWKRTNKQLKHFTSGPKTCTNGNVSGADPSTSFDTERCEREGTASLPALTGSEGSLPELTHDNEVFSVLDVVGDCFGLNDLSETTIVQDDYLLAEPTQTQRSEPPPLDQPSEVPLTVLVNRETTSQDVPRSEGTAVEALSVPGPSHKIPSPFKRHFYYPATQNSKEKKKITQRERMPTIVSGKLCQDYFKRKMKKKEDLEQLKAERAAERKRKKEEMEKLKEERASQRKMKKAKIVEQPSSESSASDVEVSSGESIFTEPSEDEVSNKNFNWDPVQRCLGEFVAFKYEGAYFPGRIEKLNKAGATVTSMQKCGRLWKWPDKPDVLFYPWASIIGHINEPKKISKTRNVYSVRELDFIWR